jgi:FMN-dependent NADH-azoreductase
MEHQESYLQTVFGFLGITDVRFVRAEGLSMGDAPKAQALAGAAEATLAATQLAANQVQAALAA